MVYKRLKNGTHAVGFVHDGKFVAYATAFDALNTEVSSCLQALKGARKMPRIGPRVDQGTYSHVATDSGETI